jgi:hypothetical protein
MEIRNRTTGAVLTEEQFRFQNPDTSFSEVLTQEVIDGFDCDIVLEGAQPTLTPPYQYAKRDGIVEINGQWFTRYIAAEFDAQTKTEIDEKQKQLIREERNKKLQDCDWTQLSDSTADKTTWMAYRQDLRLVPQQAGFPWNITWPQEPTIN